MVSACASNYLFFDFHSKLVSNCVFPHSLYSITLLNFKKQVVGFFKKQVGGKSNFG